jgi:hypothetical protein
MPRRALVQYRPYLFASILAALAWFYLRGGEVPELYLLPVKGAAVALLGVFLWKRHSAPEARLMAAAMGVAAAADVAQEVSIAVGGLIHFAYHLMALGVYLQHKRGALDPVDKAIVVTLLLGPAVLGFILPTQQGQATSFYALALGAMAAGAWISTFPRWQVGAGAMLFVASDLLLFAQLGPLATSPVPQVLVWPVYYLGQFLIATGIVRALRKRDPQLRVVRNR